MALVTHHGSTAWDQVRGCRGLLGLAACLMVGGCAQLPGGPDALTLNDAPPQSLAQSKTGLQLACCGREEMVGRLCAINQVVDFLDRSQISRQQFCCRLKSQFTGGLVRTGQVP